MAANSDDIRKSIQQSVELMSAADADGIAELYADDATIEDPIGAELVRGREAIRAFYAGVVGNLKLELTGPPRVAAGEAAFPMRAQLGENGLDVIDVMAFDDDGRIVSMRAFSGPEQLEQG